MMRLLAKIFGFISPFPNWRRFWRGVFIAGVKKKMIADGRFSWPSSYSEKLKTLKIRRYEFADMKISDIRRRKFGGTGISECVPYLYLITGDRKIYTDYVLHYYPLPFKPNQSKDDFIKYCFRNFDSDIKSLSEFGYDPRRGVVIVNGADNEIMDGVHRTSWLCSKYGPDLVIKVLRLWVE
jgi:hypothetical protein